MINLKYLLIAVIMLLILLTGCSDKIYKTVELDCVDRRVIVSYWEFDTKDGYFTFKVDGRYYSIPRGDCSYSVIRSKHRSTNTMVMK